jgi:signal transduction histidine kinase
MTDEDKIRHDFKNQLAVIRGFSEILLADAACGDARRADLQEIHTAALNALSLLDRLYPAASGDASLGLA